MFDELFLKTDNRRDPGAMSEEGWLLCHFGLKQILSPLRLGNRFLLTVVYGSVGNVMAAWLVYAYE